MAINSASVDAQQFVPAVFGFRTDRAAATLPATLDTVYFTIAGGRVAILGVVGEVTTIVQAQACNLKLIAAPTTGTAVDMCAVLNISGKEAGTLFGITGTFATALVGANAGAGVMCATPVVVPIGSIKLSTSATNTGATKWSIFWLPLDDGATLVAA